MCAKRRRYMAGMALRVSLVLKFLVTVTGDSPNDERELATA
jgi:hypothetical protein